MDKAATWWRSEKQGMHVIIRASATTAAATHLSVWLSDIRSADNDHGTLPVWSPRHQPWRFSV
ncbi:hypothetical protein [Labrys sp. 22185]|uniref:hypothetical protein n=1 Tax=Labrys sp. 22185 TaxID=3453888 RepID=UPI003F847153